VRSDLIATVARLMKMMAKEGSARRRALAAEPRHRQHHRHRSWTIHASAARRSRAAGADRARGATAITPREHRFVYG